MPLHPAVRGIVRRLSRFESPSLLDSPRFEQGGSMRDPAGIRPPLTALGRRRFMAAIVGGILAAPLTTQAQQASKVYRIGLLATRPNPATFDPFVAEMQKYGWTKDRDYTLEARFTEGYYQRAPALA